VVEEERKVVTDVNEGGEGGVGRSSAESRAKSSLKSIIIDRPSEICCKGRFSDVMY
jgi:hypothetical protein